MLTWRQLTALARVDIAEAHLACAADLPGAEGIDGPSCLDTLDFWASQVRKATNGATSQFERQPGRFHYSEAYFRMLVLVTTLQRDLGVWATDKLNSPNPDLSDSRDLFLHGVLEGRGGTCSSLPPLYAAVGRRLNYPLCLVAAPFHLFLRWDSGEDECFNVECTSAGLFTPPDEYYLTWPRATRPEELRGTYHLKSLTPREELSGFLVQRAYCLAEVGRYREAVESCAWAHELAPYHRLHGQTLGHLMGRWDARLRHLLPPPFPALTIGLPPRQFASVPLHTEREITRLKVLEDLANCPEIQSAYRRPIRRSPETGLPLGLPGRIVVRCPAGEPGGMEGARQLRRIP